MGRGHPIPCPYTLGAMAPLFYFNGQKSKSLIHPSMQPALCRLMDVL